MYFLCLFQLKVVSSPDFLSLFPHHENKESEPTNDGISAFYILFILGKLTVMCLSIGTPKIINFPFVPNGKFIIFSVSQNLGTLHKFITMLKYWDT